MSALSYQDDAADRIIAVLALEGVQARERLAAAARLAGGQIEWLMPVVFGHSINGRPIAGKFTAITHGTLLFVLADEQRVAAVHLPAQHDLVGRIVEGARALREFIATNAGCTLHGAVASMIELFLREYGGAPGEATPPAGPRAITNTVALLFAGLTDDEVRQTLDRAQEIAAQGFALAFVALRGPGAKPGTTAGCWPLLLHLAPYVDTALLDAAEAGGRA